MAQDKNDPINYSGGRGSAGNGPTGSLPPVTYAPRPPRLRKPEFWMVSLGLISIPASWVLLVLFARARTIPNPEPRVQFMQDMGTQPKFREQQSSTIFADGRADRLPIPGTVARGQLQEDDHYFRGYVMTDGKPVFETEFPAQIEVTTALIHRGQQRFNIYCSVCHGLDGHGHGQVNERAMELSKMEPDSTSWTQAADLTTAPGICDRPVGHIFNTINVGIRNMPGYGAQVPVEDRWAIVSYVRVLQQNAHLPPAAPTTAPADKVASN